MTPQRWEQICEVLEKALELPPDERSPFVHRGLCLRSRASFFLVRVLFACC